MKILFVWKLTKWSKNNFNEKMPEFIEQQINYLTKNGVVVDIYFLKNRADYFLTSFKIRKYVIKNDIDIIHCHFGLTALSCLFVPKPLFINYIGSDINILLNNIISSFVGLFASKRIFVSEKLKNKAFISFEEDLVIPYGVDFNVFFPVNKNDAKKALNLNSDINYCLFPSNPNRPEKNFKMTRDIIKNFKNIQILKFDNWLPLDKINLIYNACDFVIFTSTNEGSAQVIKEACATNRPIISLDVGDTKEIISGLENCKIFKTYNKEVNNFILSAINNNLSSNARSKIESLSVNKISEKLINLYELHCKK